ncbi:MAG TPA: hypothetical protein VFP72_05715, partial [Kineosporiaceae bacterium]|nr:hypothetical protein [Kineosporiaceae bacterium]
MTTTPDHLRPAMTALQDLYQGVLTRARSLQDLRDAGRDVWTVSPELAAERADLAPVTVTITDYREVLTHPAIARTADALLREVLMRGHHLGYVIDLGVDLDTDPTALEWLRLLPIAGTVKATVSTAAGWTLHRSDPAAAAAWASHAAEAVMVPSHAARTRPSSPNPDNKSARDGASRSSLSPKRVLD